VLPKLGVEIWDNPKLKKMADIGIELTVAGKFCPSIGDCGSVFGTSRVAWSAALQGPAFTHYGDPRHAKALSLMGATSRHLWNDYFDEEAVAQVVAEQGTDLGLKTRNLGGYGLAVLESGEGENRRAVTMYYGDATGGHGHADRLNIEMFAHGRALLTENGYPTPFTRPNFHQWRRANTVRHYCVMIDELPQLSLHAGDLNTLATTPEVQLMDASAEIAYPGLASLYRRTTALIDVSEEDSYLLDIFRVRGGTQHDWCYHGPPLPEFAIAGGELGPVQEKGTLAGEDVPYGAKPPASSRHKRAPSSGFQGLFDVRRMSPQGAWSATWRKPDEDLTLTMTMPAGCTQAVITALGEPELTRGSPDTLQYVVGRNTLPKGHADRELFSKYIAAIEPHRGAASITAVEHLRGQGVSAEAVGLAVRRGETVDLIHSSPSAEEQCVWTAADERLVVAAEFALLTLDERGLRRAVIVNGTLLQYGKFALRPDPSPTGKVLDVDPKRNAITIDRALPLPDAVEDAVVILGNERHSTSYTVKEAQATGDSTTLHFGDVLFIVGMGAVAGIDETAKTVTSDRRLTGYGRTDGGRHVGRWLYNEDQSQGFRIASISGSKVELEGVDGDLGAIFRDVDGDSRRLYWISDIGPGDTFRIPTTTYYAR